MFSNMFSEKAMSTKRRIVRMMTLDVPACAGKPQRKEKAMTTKRRIVQMMTLVAVLGFLGGGLAWAGKIYVDAVNCTAPGDGSKGNPYCKIQDAVNLATTGAHIKVYDGIYQENVVIPGGKDSLILNGRSAPTIDCQDGPGTGITVQSHGNIIKDFVIIDCLVGIKISGDSNLIEYNELSGNGRGIVVEGIGNHIAENLVGHSTSHAIEATLGRSHVFEDNRVADNGGWGIVIRRTSDADLLQENWAWHNGLGGYLIDGSSNDWLSLEG